MSKFVYDPTKSNTENFKELLTSEIKRINKRYKKNYDIPDIIIYGRTYENANTSYVAEQLSQSSEPKIVATVGFSSFYDYTDAYWDRGVNNSDFYYLYEEGKEPYPIKEEYTDTDVNVWLDVTLYKINPDGPDGRDEDYGEVSFPISFTMMQMRKLGLYRPLLNTMAKFFDNGMAEDGQISPTKVVSVEKIKTIETIPTVLMYDENNQLVPRLPDHIDIPYTEVIEKYLEAKVVSAYTDNLGMEKKMLLEGVDFGYYNTWGRDNLILLPNNYAYFDFTFVCLCMVDKLALPFKYREDDVGYIRSKESRWSNETSQLFFKLDPVVEINNEYSEKVEYLFLPYEATSIPPGVFENIRLKNTNGSSSGEMTTKVHLGKISRLENMDFRGCKIYELHVPSTLTEIDESIFDGFSEIFRILVDNEQEIERVKGLFDSIPAIRDAISSSSSYVLV